MFASRRRSAVVETMRHVRPAPARGGRGEHDCFLGKGGLSVAKSCSDLTAVAWAADERIGNNSIYIQNVNPDCSLGQEDENKDKDDLICLGRGRITSDQA
jgi:hypothetical protein